MANDNSRTRHLSYDLGSRNLNHQNSNIANSSMLRISQWLDNHKDSFGTVRKNPTYNNDHRYKQQGKLKTMQYCVNDIDMFKMHLRKKQDTA